MKQVIISEVADAYGVTVDAVVLQVKHVTTGQPAASTDDATIATAGEMRIARKGATTSDADIASPWFRGKDVVNVELKEWADLEGEAHALTFSGYAAAAVGEVATLKIILTTAGYEPFVRHNIEFKAAGSDILSADAAATAALTMNLPGVTSVLSGGDAVLTVLLDNGERAAIAFDSGDSEIILTDAIDPAVVPNGTPAVLRALEIAQAGREDGNYDRFNVFAAEVATNVVAGSTYDVLSLTIRNSAEGQIRGVDNVRVIDIAIKQGADDTARDAFVTAVKKFSDLA